MEKTPLIIYLTEWCGDCRRTLNFLKRYQVPYISINIDHNREGEKFVCQHNRGNRSVPTLVLPDGSILVEPSDQELARKLGLTLSL